MFGAPRRTMLGGWRYDDPAAQGRDKIVDVGDFTGSGRNEILIWSRSGLAALALDGGGMLSRRMHSNGVRLGGWVISTADNRYWGRGRFETGSHDVMVVSSPWGLGLISLQLGRHIFMAPNGTRFGSWTLQTAVDEFLLIGDFDGDGEDELFVRGRSGVAVLKLVDGALTAIAHHRIAESLGGYVLEVQMILSPQAGSGRVPRIRSSSRIIAGCIFLLSMLVASCVAPSPETASGSMAGLSARLTTSSLPLAI